MFPQNSVPRDGNREPALLGVSSSDLKTVVPVAVDPATNRLLVSSSGSSGGTSSSYGAAFPATGTAVGFTDGTNMQPGKVFDADSGAGTDLIQGVQLRKSASGGSVEAGTSTNPLRVDPTGSTTQPISAASLPLPTGAATAVKQPALGTAGTASADVITVQGISSMTALKVDGSTVTQPVSISGTLPVNMTQLNGVATSVNNGTTDTGTQRVTLSSDSTGQVKLATGANVIGSISNTAFTANIGTTNGLALDATFTGGTAQVQGNIASGSTDSGNPLKIGGVNMTTQPTLTDGQRGNAQLDTRANLKVSLVANNSATGLSVRPDNVDGVAVSSTTDKLTVLTRGTIYNPASTAWDRLYSVTNATNSTGAGITAVGNLAQFDDVSPTAITENQFGNLRMSANRNLYGTIRDAAGNERGANVDSSNNLMVNIAAGLVPAATSLNTYSVHLTSNTTTTPTSSTAYISSISISSEVAGTTSTVTIQDKQGTPLKLVNGFSTTTLTTTPTVVNFQTPVKMVSGIDIVTAGAVAATIDVWINYYG